MRQRAEHEIEPERGPVEAVEGHELGQRIGRELRKHLAHLLPGLAVGGQQRDFDLRMAQQQAHAFRSGIAGSAEHADLCQPGHVLILSTADAAGNTGYPSNFERNAPRNRRPQVTINRAGSARPHGAAAAQGRNGHRDHGGAYSDAPRFRQCSEFMLRAQSASDTGRPKRPGAESSATGAPRCAGSISGGRLSPWRLTPWRPSSDRRSIGPGRLGYRACAMQTALPVPD